MNIQDIKLLNDKELLEKEHDLEVDIIHDLSGNLELDNIYDELVKEIKKRNLIKLPRLNGFS